MQPLVSITLATYNIESFIQLSLECILKQTLQNIEVICFDDASTDNTAYILKEIAKTDSRLKVIFKSKNEGLAVARNEALELARGKYICFVDGDDLMDKNLFEKAYALAEQTNCNMVLWDYLTFWDEYQIKSKKLELSSLVSISDKDKVALLERPAFTWIKLIKTETIRNLRIQFPNGLTKQDIPVHWELITKIDSIAILPERLSYYRQQPNATSYKTDVRLFDIAIIMDIVKRNLIENQYYEVYKNVFLKQQLSLLSVMYDFIDKPFKCDAITIIKKRIGEDQLNYIYSKNPLLLQSRLFHKALQGSVIHKMYFKIWLIFRGFYRKILN